MTIELFEQGPGVYIPYLLISLLITLVAYGSYPLLYAKFQNEPITAIKYRWICFFANLIPMIIFFFLSRTSSGGPYLLWTSVFTSVGKQILERKKLLKDPDSPEHVPSSEPPAGTTLEYTGKFQQPADFVPVPAKSMKTNNRFCKLCGSSIEPSTKKCTGCGKQYFRLPARKKGGFIPKVVTILSVVFVCLCVYRIVLLERQLSDMQTLISEQESKIAKQESTIAELGESEEKLQKRIAEYSSNVASLKGQNATLTRENGRMERVYNFCNDHVVVVSDDGSRTYHKIGCFYFDDSYFWAYNLEAAQQQGYKPCSFCFSRYFDSLTS